jgi:copper(I)-binding protein
MEQIKPGNTMVLKSDARYVVLITRVKMLTRDQKVYVEGRTRDFGDMKWEGTFPITDWEARRTNLHKFYNVKG